MIEWALSAVSAVMAVVEAERKMATIKQKAVPRTGPTHDYTLPVTEEEEAIQLIAYASATAFASGSSFVVTDLYNNRVVTAPPQRTAVEIQARIAEASKPKKKEIRKHDAHAMLDLEERKVETPPPLPARPVELP